MIKNKRLNFKVLIAAIAILLSFLPFALENPAFAKSGLKVYAEITDYGNENLSICASELYQSDQKCRQVSMSRYDGDPVTIGPFVFDKDKIKVDDYFQVCLKNIDLDKEICKRE